MMPLAQYPGHGYTELCFFPAAKTLPDGRIRVSHSCSHRFPTEALREALAVLGAPWPLPNEPRVFAGVLEGQLPCSTWDAFHRYWTVPAQNAIHGKKPIPADCSHDQLWLAISKPSSDDELNRRAKDITGTLQQLNMLQYRFRDRYNFVVIR